VSTGFYSLCFRRDLKSGPVSVHGRIHGGQVLLYTLQARSLEVEGISLLEPNLPRTQFIQTLVAIAFFVDTVSTLGDYVCVYLVSVYPLRFTRLR
jgi:hypothetical protein